MEFPRWSISWEKAIPIKRIFKLKDTYIINWCYIDLHHQGCICISWLDIPQLQKPILGDPYISDFQMFGLFNATKFSIDCNFNPSPIDYKQNNGQLKIETVFRMNDDEVARFVLDYPVSEVTLDESKLAGHIGKKVVFNVLKSFLCFFKFPKFWHKLMSCASWLRG